MPLVGAHVGQEDPLGDARDRGCEVVQLFLGDPQGWKAPAAPEGLPALASAGVAVYVHAPYVLNVATSNNRIRIPSRKLLQQHVDAAAAAGAKGLVVHGGHVLAGDDPAVGVENWRKTFERLDAKLPVLIENTAGGGKAMARRLDAIARLWDAVGDLGAGFCLDTCHFHAGGEDLAGVVERVRAATGRVDLVHANGSRDAFDSGADRHANLDASTFEASLVLEVCAQAGSDVVVETPAQGQAADIAAIRARLAG